MASNLIPHHHRGLGYGVVILSLVRCSQVHFTHLQSLPAKIAHLELLVQVSHFTHKENQAKTSDALARKVPKLLRNLQLDKEQN